MPSPFPGMDPYLEDPAFWSDFHASFITYWRDALSDCLADNYEARIDEKVRLVEVAPPRRELIEEETHERYIEILHRPERALVAVLELLSPANKEEPGRSDYLAKRNALLRYPIHLVEVDLLIGGRRLPPEDALPPGDYYALVSRGDRRPDCDVYAWPLRNALPAIPIPLRPPDPDVWLDLAGVFATTYERGRYARSLNYAAPPPISLDDETRRWAMERARRQWPGVTSSTLGEVLMSSRRPTLRSGPGC
jgi:hypothetical protein